jgi:hypothetical protein
MLRVARVVLNMQAVSADIGFRAAKSSVKTAMGTAGSTTLGCSGHVPDNAGRTGVIMADYLPYREADLLAWSTNWAALTNASPETYGLTVQQAANYQTLHDAFATAWDVTHGPNRGPAATQTKKSAKEALIRGQGGIRQLVGIVQKFPGTTDTMRVQLKITVPDAEPTPVPPPSQAPEFDLKPPVMRRVTITLHNETVLGRRGKPDGVAGALIFSFVGASPPSPQETHLWKMEANITKTTTEVQFPPTVPPGATVWFTAFWYNPRGQSGPSAPAVYTILPGTLSQAA